MTQLWILNVFYKVELHVNIRVNACNWHVKIVRGNRKNVKLFARLRENQVHITNDVYNFKTTTKSQRNLIISGKFIEED